MDKFNVPKKVNRHVLKALHILSEGRCKDSVRVPSIVHQVKYQMRNLVPVRDIESAVHNSLQNMSCIGLIECHGPDCFAIGHSYGLEEDPQQPQPNDNNPLVGSDHHLLHGEAQLKRTRSSVDANMKRNRGNHSDDSFSGDDFDGARKRMRSNNMTIRHAGHATELPRARQHVCSAAASCSCQNHKCGNSSYAIVMPHYPSGEPAFPYGHDHAQFKRQRLGASSSQSCQSHNGMELSSISHLQNMLSTVTSVPSLQGTDATEEGKQTYGVRLMLETPLLHGDEPMIVQGNETQSETPTTAMTVATSTSAETDDASLENQPPTQKSFYIN